MTKPLTKFKTFITIITIFVICKEAIHLYQHEKTTMPFFIEYTAPVTKEENKRTTDFTYYRQLYKNDDLIGRLVIPNLLDIFLVQGKNNEYYLTHSIQKRKDNRGTEFLDYRITPNSKQINIYGHNSNTLDIPFKKLEKFLDKDFFTNNSFIILEHDNGTRTYQILVLKEITDDYEHMKIDTTDVKFKRHLDLLTENAIYKRNIPYDENANILIIQTCSYAKENSYYLLIAIETE